MKTLIIVLALMTSLSGCAQDDQAFNIDKLTPRHQEIFIEAMEILNAQKMNAFFTISDDAISVTYYGRPQNPNAIATTRYDIQGVRIFRWKIIFRPQILNRSDESLFSSTIHELCHVLLGVPYTKDEHRYNPITGSCAD